MIGKVLIKTLICAMIALLAFPCYAVAYDMMTQGNVIGVVMGSLFSVTMISLAGFFIIL